MKRFPLKKILISLLISCFVVTFFYYFSQTDFFQSLEMKSFDQRMAMRTQDVGTNQDIVVVLVDESSLDAMEDVVGRWPWPRSIFGDLVTSLTEWGAKSILFDVLYTEPSVPRDQEGNLGKNDMSLVEATAAGGNTVHAVQLFKDDVDDYNTGLLNHPMPKEFVEQFGMKNIDPNTKLDFGYNKFYLPIRELYENSWGIGIVEFSSDKDGVYRSSELVREYQGNYFPTLSMAYLQSALNVQKILINDDSIDLDGLNIPLLEHGRYLINMKQKFTNYSIAGILATMQKLQNGETEGLIVNPEEFQDKVVLIGASATGVEDLKLTSLGNRVPGVYLHASIISNVLNKSFIQKFNETLIYFLVFLSCFILCMLVLNSHTIVPSVVTFLFLVTSYLLLSFYILDYYRIWLLVAAPIASLLFSFLVAFIYMSFTEGKEKRFLKAAFSNYISPELIDMMHASGEPPKLGGDVGVRTAYFTDIQSFSTFSEKLSATLLVELLNEYLTAMTDILLEEQGTLDKYEGDAIIAFFGAPMPLEDHAVRACKVAIKMQEKLLELRAKWVKDGDHWPEIVHKMRMRIGVNSGEMVTGNMGSKTRMNYTMMGDTVNLAARLEEAAKQYGIFTHISQFTYDLVGDHFEVRELDTIRVVGKSEHITSYELLGLKNQTDDLLLKLRDAFHQGLKFYKEQKWDDAISAFEKSLELELEREPDLKDKVNPSKLYIERCQDYKENPPGDDWDGVFTLTSK